VENYKLNALLEAKQPRERLAEIGERNLSNQELLAIILRTGTFGESVNVLAQKILDKYLSLHDFKKASLADLQKIKGVGKNKAILLKAMIELGRRIHFSSKNNEDKIVSSLGLGKQMIEEMKDFEQEHFVVIFLNTKNFIIKKKTIFIGSLNQSIAHPREILKEGLNVNAASVILVHNHPSGIATPSREDLLLTERIARGAYMIGINLVDHLIIGNDDYHSMRENNQIKMFK